MHTAGTSWGAALPARDTTGWVVHNTAETGCLDAGNPGCMASTSTSEEEEGSPQPRAAGPWDWQEQPLANPGAAGGEVRVWLSLFKRAVPFLKA